MELTLDQALQKGVEAHKAGKAQEADKYYTAIIKVQPKHPDANHNMGVLAVGVGKVEQALAFFRTAIEANPKIEQFWLSYMDALIKLDRMADAKSVLDQAKNTGMKGDGLDKIEKKLVELEKVEDVNPAELKSRDPSKDQMQSLINLYTQGQYRTALTQASHLMKRFPKNIILYNIIGAANQGLGKLDQAVFAFQEAIKIKPDYADAYNNMGIVLKDQGKLGEAIEAFNKAISIKPDYAEAHNNKGVTLNEQGKGDEAIEAYTKALSLNLSNAEPYYNIGNALQDQGKLEEAIESYNQALSIKPEYAEAYHNMGNALKDQGKLKEAIEALNKAILLKPDYTMAWNNIYFPLQAIKTERQYKQDLNALCPKNSDTGRAKISLSILHYRLQRGHVNEEIILNNTLKDISSLDGQIIKNLAFDNELIEKNHIEPNRIIALVHFGRSGTGLLHSLIDGHQEISTLPSIYLSEYFDFSTWDRIISAGWDGMVDRFVSMYEVLFDATSPVPIESISKQLIYNIGIDEGMANVGNEKDEILTVDKSVFKKELNRLIRSYSEMDPMVFFKLVHLAYDKAIQEYDKKNLIFYHIHNPDTCAKLNFSRLCPDVNWIMMVREPVQSCESWIEKNYHKGEYTKVVNQITSMLLEIDNFIYSKQRSVGVRLEDLKKKPKRTIKALCTWMGIEETVSLYEMTAQGKKWWGDPTSRDYSKDGMEPFGKTSIDRKIGSIFSKNDQYVLSTLFYPFCAHFGYVEQNSEKFKVDLKTVRPMLDEMLDFEKILADNKNFEHCKFMKAGSYLYFRACLIDRWEKLNEFGTYTYMISPLKI